MKKPTQEEIMKKWAPILGSMGMTGSKLDSLSQLVEGGEFVEKKLEDDEEYKKLMKKGVTPMSGPSGNLFYLDFKYGNDINV